MVLQEFSLAVIQNSRKKLLMKKRQHGNWMCKTSGRIILTHNASNSLSLGSRSPAWLLVIRWPQVGFWPAGKTYLNYHGHHEFKISILHLPRIKNTGELQVTSPIRSSANLLEHRAFLDGIMRITVRRSWMTKTRVNREQDLLTAFPRGLMRRGSIKVGRCKPISACIWLHRLLLNYIGKLPTEFIIL